MVSLCGLDEAGRGPLAGPLVAAAVILPPNFDFAARFPAIRFGDSKRLSAHQREVACELIRQSAAVLAVEVISVEIIDQLGIGWANRTIFERLIMAVEADTYIVDGNLKLWLTPERWGKVHSRVRADQTVPEVSAASIVAKITRDHLMRELHERFPVYHWSTNNGYGTREHIRAIRDYGITPHHRRQFVGTALENVLAAERALSNETTNNL